MDGSPSPPPEVDASEIRLLDFCNGSSHDAGKDLDMMSCKDGWILPVVSILMIVRNKAVTQQEGLEYHKLHGLGETEIRLIWVDEETVVCGYGVLCMAAQMLS